MKISSNLWSVNQIDYQNQAKSYLLRQKDVIIFLQNADKLIIFFPINPFFFYLVSSR